MSKCAINSNKQYIIPTRNWLKPIEEFITGDSNTAGLIMLGELIDKEKIIVKITKNVNNKIIILGTKLNSLHNFVKTHCSFYCTERYEKINNKYKDSSYFCSNTSPDYITVEVMKKYSGSLSSLKGTLTRDQVTNILSQIVLSLMEAFYKFGFIHEDMSLGNVLYRIKSTNEIIDYDLSNFKTMRMNLNIGDIIPIISDYDKIESYKKEIYEQYSKEPINKLIRGYQETKTLFDSLSKIIQNCIELITNVNERLEIKSKINEIISSSEYEEQYRWTYKTLKYYIIERDTSYDEMIKETFIVYRTFINKIMKVFNRKRFDFIPIDVDNL